MFRRISVKVAVFVNLILICVMAIGTLLLVNQQWANMESRYQAGGKLMATFGAKAYARLLEEGVNANVISLDDVFDTKYVKFGSFDPPKYNTKFDAYTDRVMIDLLDEFMKNTNVVFAVGADKNGYIPTHNSKYQRAITGDVEKDKVGNRAKRIFADPVGLKAAENRIEGFIQVYKRDTGETMWDVASPIMVKGRQWGNFRVGLSIDELNRQKTEILYALLGIMSIILLISVSAVILVVNFILRPLTKFTKIASNLADGDVDVKIEVTSDDEIGDLGKVLERMRISLKVAMDRLRKK